MHVAVADVAEYVRLALVCKRMAFLVLTEERIWKRVALGREVGVGGMWYRWGCDLDGRPLGAQTGVRQDDEDLDVNDDETVTTLPSQQVEPSTALLPSPYPTFKNMFRTRPRLRFNGCYISTVNYTRPGAGSTNTLTWGTPVHVVTYFRYLRFFRDGTAISLLTTAEPGDVVHHLTKANLHRHHAGSLPSAVMKDALGGRWMLSGSSKSKATNDTDASATPATDAVTTAQTKPSAQSPAQDESEEEGILHIQTHGVIPKYTYQMQFRLGHAGKSTRNNKLTWLGFWSHNRLTDDWGEFGLRNDRAFYWSRVRSWRGE